MMEKIKQRLKSKTYWLALAGAVLTVVEVNNGLFGSLIPVEYRVWALAFWPVLMMFAREITTTALSDK